MEELTALRLFLGALGVMIAGSIVYLVRRDHLHGVYAVSWVLVAIATLLFGLFPSLVDAIGHWLGVAYPPALIGVLALAFVAIKLLINDIERSRLERQMRTLAQRLALYEGTQEHRRDLE
jgi:hypothetical protein